MLFLYRNVLSLELGLVDSVRAKPSQHVPTVLSRAEVQAVLHEMSGIHLLMARLLYGSGMRLMECIRFRKGDIDLSSMFISSLRGAARAKPNWKIY